MTMTYEEVATRFSRWEDHKDETIPQEFLSIFNDLLLVNMQPGTTFEDAFDEIETHIETKNEDGPLALINGVDDLMNKVSMLESEYPEEVGTAIRDHIGVVSMDYGYICS